MNLTNISLPMVLYMNGKKEDANDTYLRFLVRNHTAVEYINYIVPFSMNLNLKGNEEVAQRPPQCSDVLQQNLRLHPPTTNKTALKIRRSVRPYFGLEINAKL